MQAIKSSIVQTDFYTIQTHQGSLLLLVKDVFIIFIAFSWYALFSML